MAVFGLIGLVLIGAAAAVYFADRRVTTDALRAEGIVVELMRSGKGYKPLVHIQVEGRTHEILGTVSSSPPSFSVGDRVDVLYPPGNPAAGVIDSFMERYFVPVLLTGLGAIFGSIGLVFGIVRFVSARRRARVFSLGLPAKAKVVAIELDRTMSVNNRHPWRARAEFQDSVRRETRSALSHRIWDDPRPHYPPGAEITVYYIPDEPNSHAFVFEKMGERVPDGVGFAPPATAGSVKDHWS